LLEKLVRQLGQIITPIDKLAHMKRSHRLRVERALEMGVSVEDLDTSECTEKGKTQLEWTWDPENCSCSMTIQDDGMIVVMKEPVDYANRVSWEYKMRNNWVPYKADVQTKLEKGYKSGNCYK
jgi:hypothetical protein